MGGSGLGGGKLATTGGLSSSTLGSAVGGRGREL